jgi:hypothetical protein
VCIVEDPSKESRDASFRKSFLNYVRQRGQLDNRVDGAVELLQVAIQYN